MSFVPGALPSIVKWLARANPVNQGNEAGAIPDEEDVRLPGEKSLDSRGLLPGSNFKACNVIPIRASGIPADFPTLVTPMFQAHFADKSCPCRQGAHKALGRRLLGIAYSAFTVFTGLLSSLASVRVMPSAASRILRK
jgi:hypothetical protein